MENRVKLHSVKYNFFMNFMLKMSSMIFPIITYPYASRILMPEGIGQVSFTSGIVAYFSMFALMGVSTYGVRICAKVRDNKEELSKTVQELLIFTLITSSFVYIVFGYMLCVVDKLTVNRTLFLVTSFQIILNVIGVDWLYSALEQYTYITIRSVCFKFIGMILMFIFVHEESDVIKYAAITVFSSYGSYIFNFIRLRRYIYFKKFDYNILRHIKPMLIFFAMSVAISLYTNFDTVMLGFMKTDYDVGIYNTSVKIKTILITLVASLGTVLLPRLSYYFSNKKESEYLLTIRKSINVVIFITVPLMAFFEIFSMESIIVLSGTEYLDAVHPMRLLLINVVFSALANITGMQILIPSNQEKVYLCGVLAGATTDLILNMIYIPKLGVMGAALGTVCAEALGLLIQIIYLRKFLIRSVDIKHMMQVLFTSMLAAVPSFCLKKFVNTYAFLTLIIGSVVFFGVYICLMVWVRNETTCHMAKQLLNIVHKRISTTNGE